MDSRFSKIIALVLIQCQFSMMLPAQELQTDLRRGMARLEHYLDRAAAERRTRDWEQLARTGLEAAMYEWESGALWLLEQNQETWQEERRRAELSYRKETEAAYVRWASERVYTERAGFEASELGALLRKTAAEWGYGDSGRIVSQADASGARAAWEQVAGEIVDRYLAAWEERQGLAYAELEDRFRELDLSDEERRDLIRGVAEEYRAMVNREYGHIALAEGNRLMAELLYDQGSTKKIAADEAAAVIARELSREAEAAAGERAAEVFARLDAAFSAEEEAGIEFAAGDWLTQFRSAFEEGLARWEEAELGFLAARAEWEHDAEDAYLAGEDSWNQAYLELTERQKAWEAAILVKLDEGFARWQENQSRLNTEIEIARSEFLAAAEENRRVKEKMLDSQAEIYVRSRQMMDMVRQGMESWYDLWNEKYLMVYTLVKQAPAMAGQFRELDENIFKSFFSANIDIDELTNPNKDNMAGLRNQIELLQEAVLALKAGNRSLPASSADLLSAAADLLDGETGWLSLAAMYREYADTAAERLYRLTGSNGERIEGYSGELGTELIKAQALLGYWDDELAVAEALNWYAQETSSLIEDAARTREALENARLDYEEAVKTYEAAVETIAEKGLVLDKAQENFEQVRMVLAGLRETVEAAQQDYANVLAIIMQMNPAPVYDELANLSMAILDSWDGKTGVPGQTMGELILNYYRLAHGYAGILRSLEIKSLLESLESGSGLGQPGIADLEARSEEARILSLSDREEDLRAAAGLYPAELPVSILWGTGPGELPLFGSGQELLVELDRAYRETEDGGEREILLNLMRRTWEEAAEWYREEALQRRESIEYLKTGALPKTDPETRAAAELQVRLEGIRAALDLSLNADPRTEFAALKTLVENILSLGPEDMAEAAAEAAGGNSLFADALEGRLVFSGEAYLAAWLAQRQAKRDLGLLTLERVQSITDRYGGCHAESINRQNQAAREAVRELIEAFRQESRDTAGREGALEYAAELRDRGQGLNQVGQEALDAYIAGFLEYAALRDFRDDPTAEPDLLSLAGAYTEARTAYEAFTAWQYQIYDEAGLAEIAGSAGFSLLSEDEQNEFTAYASSGAYTELGALIGRISAAAYKEFLARADSLVYARYYQLEKDGSRFGWMDDIAAGREKMFESGIGNETLEKIDPLFNDGALDMALGGLKNKVLWLGIWFTGADEWNYVQYQEDAAEAGEEPARAALENGWDEYQAGISLDTSLYSLVFEALDRLDYINEGGQKLNDLKNEKKAVLDAALDSYNGYLDNEYDLALKLIDQSCLDYNAAVDDADRYYQEMSAARLELRKRQEIQDWASSVYLREFGVNNDENYLSPLEKLSQVRYARERALIALEALKEIIGGGPSRVDAQYGQAMESYKESRRNYYLAQVAAYEGAMAVTRQQAVVREAELAEEAARRKLITKVEPFTPGAYDLVNLLSDGNGGYRVELTYTVQTKNVSDISSSYDPDISNRIGIFLSGATVQTTSERSDPALVNEYFGNHKAVAIERVGAEEFMSMAEYEAGEWLKRMGALGIGYYDDVMLASLYIKYCAAEGSAEGKAWFSGIRDPRSSGNYALGDIPLDTNIRGLDLRAEYNSARRNALRDAYNRVMARGGEEDIARYLLYRDRNLLGNAADYEETLLNSRAMAAVENAIGKTHRNYTIAWGVALGIGAALTATGAALMAVSFFNPGFAVLAGVAFAGAAAAFITAAALNHVRNQISAVRNGVKSLLAGVNSNLNGGNGYNTRFTVNYGEWQESLAHLSRERTILNLMTFGTEEKPDTTDENQGLSYEEFCTGLSVLFSTGGTRTAVSYDESIGLYTRELYDESGAESASTVTEAITLLNSALEKETGGREETLEEEAERLKTAQDENRMLYNSAMQSALVIPEDRQAELRALALRAGDLTLDIAERRLAGLEYERLAVELRGQTGDTREEIRALLNSAFGDDAWNSEWHAANLIGLEGELFDSRVLYTRPAETYTEGEITLLRSSALAAFDRNTALELSVKEREWALLTSDFLNQYYAWQEQVEQIRQAGLSEWQKARSRINEDYRIWQRKFSDEYQAKTGAWDLSYLDFVSEKQRWIEEQYLYAVNVENSGLFDYTEADAAQVIGQALARLSVERLDRETIDPFLYTDMILEDSILGELFSHVNSLEGRGGLGSAAVRTAAKRTSGAEDFAQVSRVLDMMNDDMRIAAAKLAAQEAQKIIEEAIRLFWERLASENSAVWEWEERLVQANGYRTDGEIRRQTPVDSTVFEIITRTQTVHRYQDYQPASAPASGMDLSTAAALDLDADTIMQLVQTARWNLDKWGETIFGRLDSDGRVVEHRIPRGFGELTAAAYAAAASAEKGRVNDLAARMEKFEARGFDSLSDEEKKEYEKLANQLVIVRDGELGAHIGYGPLLKDEVDYRHSPLDDALDRGAGEMGKIMLDFLWNSRVSQTGYLESYKAWYDQKFSTGDDSGAFTIRSIVGMAASIGGMINPIIGLADDLLFAGLDLGIGYQNPEDVFKSLAFNAATVALSYGSSALGNSGIFGNMKTGILNSLTDSLGERTGTVLYNALGSAAKSYTTSAAMNLAGAFNNGSFDSESFLRSLYSVETLSSTLGAFVGSGLGAFTGTSKTMTAGNQKLYGGLVNLGVAGASEAARYSVYALDSLVNGSGDFMNRLGQAYDNMGGITLNIANLGSILDLMGTVSYRLNENYDTKLGALGRQLAGAGLLELTLGRGDISLAPGMGGINVAGNLYDSVKHGLDYAVLKYGDYEASQDRELILRNYLYGDWAAENTSMRIEAGRDLLQVGLDGTLPNQGIRGYTTRRTDGAGRIITIADLGNTNANTLILQHESLRDGYVTGDNDMETVAAVLAHTTIAVRMLQDGMDLNVDKALLNDLLAYYITGGDMTAFARYALENYDATGDYWKLMKDGTLVNDKKGWLVDEEGNPILNSEGKQIGAKGIETGLLNILYGGTSGREYGEFTLNQISVVQQIMIWSGMLYDGEGSVSALDRTWTNVPEDKALNMNVVMSLVKDTVAETIFSKIFPGVDRYAADNTLQAGIESYVEKSSGYTKIVNTLNSKYISASECIDLFSQLQLVNTEAVISYIYDQLPSEEKASRKIYEKDFVNAQERLLQIQESRSLYSFGTTLALAALTLAGGRYVYGYENPLYVTKAGVDCSGAIIFALQLMGYNIPRSNANGIITSYTSRVTTGGILPGDINAWPDSKGIIKHVQTLTGGSGLVDPYGGEANKPNNPGHVKYRTTIQSGFDVYRIDPVKIMQYYDPSLDIMSGRLTVSQFNKAWERLTKYFQ
jgi:hypothetical protein